MSGSEVDSTFLAMSVCYFVAKVIDSTIENGCSISEADAKRLEDAVTLAATKWATEMIGRPNSSVQEMLKSLNGRYRSN